MNCKYCNAELAEDSVLCPVCGKEQEETEQIVAEEAALTEAEVQEESVVETEETELTETEEVSEATEEATEEESLTEEAEGEESEGEESEGEEEAPVPQKKSRKIVAAVIAIVLVAATLLGVVVSGLNKPDTTPATTVEIPSDGKSDSPLCKASYTVADKKAIKAADEVVATMGDKTLTNAQLQAFYWQEIYMFVQEYGSYAQYLGLDLTQPLDQQLAMLSEVSMSWQQFFLDGAIATWKNYQALALEAEAANFQMPANRQAELDSMPSDLETNALLSGFKSADELIQANVGINSSLESYLHYTNTYYQGMAYLYDTCESMEFDEQTLETFFAENEDYFTENGITKDSRNINIRHVLLMPEGGQLAEDGYTTVYSEEEWEACRQKAEEIYTQWKTGDLSEESFAQLAMDYSADGNAQQGGIYEDVTEGMMVQTFNDWCFDESREYGDHGLVKTEYGYHIMFFCGSRDWRYYARDGLINSAAYDMVPAVLEKHPAQVDFSKVQLAELNLG